MPSAGLFFDHAAFPVFDAEATYAFYSKTLGLPLIAAHNGDDWGGKEWLMMIFSLSDKRQLALIAFRNAGKPAGAGLPADSAHFAFSVASDREFKTWQQKLSSANVEFSEEDHGSQRSIYFSDPNGYVLEITTPASNGGTRSSPGATRRVKQWITGAS